MENDGTFELGRRSEVVRGDLGAGGGREKALARREGAKERIFAPGRLTGESRPIYCSRGRLLQNATATWNQ